jgi:hypothetical protein
MLDMYIKNRGMTKTIIHNNNRNIINQTNWDADYDGSVANVSLDLSKNGRNKHYDFKLNNDDLANMLSIPSVRQPIHKRLKMDFKKPQSFKQIFLELEPQTESSSSPLDFFEEIDTIYPSDNKKISSPILTHLSSPKLDEEFVMPFQDYSFNDYNLNGLEAVLKPKSHRKTKKSRRSKKSTPRTHRHHNYPSTRKSPRRSSSRRN